MKYGAICLIVFCALAVAIVDTTVVSAASFSWTDGAPTVYRSEPTEFEDQPYCPTYTQRLKIDHLADDQLVCMFSSSGLRVGSFLEDGRTSRLAIAYPLDSGFHILDGACEGLAGCLYSADRDMLVSRYGGGLRVYSGVKGRIHQSFSLGPLGVKYDFDGSSPLYSAQNEAGDALPIGAIALSRNGKWLAMEVKNEGIGLVDLDTGMARRVIAPGYQYNRGFDPREELAVSNDGTSVVAMGDNAGLTFASIDPECGDSFVESFPPDFPFGTKPCKVVSIDPNSFIQHFSLGLSPKFDDSGGQLEFVAGSIGFGARRVILRASGYDSAPDLGYLALGDSFSSGEGETDDQHYELGTDDEFERCHVSDRSYPFLLATAMQLATSAVKNVACSGARTNDITNHGIGYWGQGGRLGPLGLGLSSNDFLLAQTNSLLGFLPERVPQETFVQRYQPAVISVGIGGNDVGFMDKLKVCAMPGTCEWAASQDGRHAIGLEIQSLFNKLVDLYQQLRLDAPFARLYAVGYSEIMSPSGTCDPLTGFLFDADERNLVSEGITYLNQVIAAASRGANIPFLNIEQSLSGRELCESTGSPSGVNGLRLGDDIALSRQLPMLKIIGKESFHPNPSGHELIARAILQQRPDLRVGGGCDGCGTPVDPPPLPSDWSEGGSDRGALEDAAFVSPADIARTTPTFTFSLPAGSLEPNSTAYLEVHSDVEQLGAFTTETDGSVRGEARLPGTLAEGFHTIHLYGDSFSHQPVDLYQVVSFGDQTTTEEVGSISNADTSPLIGRQGENVLGYSTAKPPSQSGDAPRAAHGSTHILWLSLVVIAGGVLLTGAGFCIVLWRRRHNCMQDRGG